MDFAKLQEVTDRWTRYFKGTQLRELPVEYSKIDASETVKMLKSLRLAAKPPSNPLQEAYDEVQARQRYACAFLKKKYGNTTGYSRNRKERRALASYERAYDKKKKKKRKKSEGLPLFLDIETHNNLMPAAE